MWLVSSWSKPSPKTKHSRNTLNDQMLVGLLLVQITVFKNKAASVSCIVQQGYLWLFCIQHLISLGISFYSLVWEWGQKCLKSNMMINANQLSSATKPLGFN